MTRLLKNILKVRSQTSLRGRQMINNKVNYDLQERLIDFVIDIILLVEYLPDTKSANHIGAQ